jgi:hypothetical protein
MSEWSFDVEFTDRAAGVKKASFTINPRRV